MSVRRNYRFRPRPAAGQILVVDHDGDVFTRVADGIEDTEFFGQFPPAGWESVREEPPVVGRRGSQFGRDIALGAEPRPDDRQPSTRTVTRRP